MFKISRIMRLQILTGLYLLIFGFTSSVIAIVNMDGLHFSKNEESFSTDLAFLLTGASGNTNTSTVSLKGQFSWAAKKSINLAILSYQYGETNDVVNKNKAFMHYRHIHKITDTIDWEVFLQVEKNEFTRLLYRELVGVGMLFSVSKSQSHRSYLGTGIFHSREKIDFRVGLTDDGTEQIIRGNFYFLSKYKVKPTISYSYAIYYQPKLNQVSDYRALLNSNLDFKITENLNFRLSLEIEYDNKPSQTIKKTDINYLSGITLKF